MDSEIEGALRARTVYLVKSGQAIYQGQGFGFRPKAWAQLRNSELKHVMARDLVMKTPGQVSHCHAHGIVEGHITTSLGTHAIINRGVGCAAMAMQSGQDLAVGKGIGRALRVER